MPSPANILNPPVVFNIGRDTFLLSRMFRALPAAIAQTAVTENVINRNVGKTTASCKPTGRVASMNWGRNAAIKIRLLGFGTVTRTPVKTD